jgi:NAD(P)-dependent dehydrogenase (short-subunit alcohol dehydrogenase family)
VKAERWAGGSAVVTGAGSSIGRAIAQQVAQRGMKVALADVNREGLAESRRITHEFAVGGVPQY